MRIWLAVILIALLLPAAARGVDMEETRRSLRGIKSVCVVVDGPGDKALGFDKQRFQTDAELKLRLAGLKVVGGGVGGDPDACRKADAILVINVNAFAMRPGFFACAINMKLSQRVRLTSGEEALGATWDVAALGSGSLDDVRGYVRDSADEFVNAWLSVNPKK